MFLGSLGGQIHVNISQNEQRHQIKPKMLLNFTNLVYCWKWLNLEEYSKDPITQYITRYIVKCWNSCKISLALLLLFIQSKIGFCVNVIWYNLSFRSYLSGNPIYSSNKKYLIFHFWSYYILHSLLLCTVYYTVYTPMRFIIINRCSFAIIIIKSAAILSNVFTFHLLCNVFECLAPKVKGP